MENCTYFRALENGRSVYGTCGRCLHRKSNVALHPQQRLLPSLLFLLSLLALFGLSATPAVAQLQKSDVAISTSNYNSPGRNASPINFSHKVLVHPLSGLPSAITLAVEDIDISEVRALMVLDGELLVVDLKYYKMADVYHATFPAPKLSLSYQFQIIAKDGESFLSNNYFVDPRCKDDAVENILSSAQISRDKESRIRYALGLDHQRVTLEYLIKIISDFAKAELGG